MSIFRRRPTTSEVPDAETELEPTAAVEVETPPAEDAPSDRAEGPFDVSEVDGLGDRVDLGAVWIAPVTGAELRLEVDQSKARALGVSSRTQAVIAVSQMLQKQSGFQHSSSWHAR